MMPEFLTDFWYVALRSEDLAAAPVARTICGNALAFFRTADGSPAAVDDACPHRHAPLSLGTVVPAGHLRCPYHGMLFDRTGTCIDIPTQTTRIPITAHVRSYPVIERHGLIWIWPGTAESADPAAIPQLAWRSDPGWNSETIQYFPVAAAAGLTADNLLDLSHVAFIHSTIAFDPEILRNDPLVSEIDGDLVRSTRIFHDVPPAPAHRRWHSFAGNVTRTSISEWRPPGIVSVLVRNEDERVRLDLRYDHMMTPETPATHHYFIALARNFALDDAVVTTELDAEALAVHAEDLAMIEAQAKTKARLGERREVALRQDRGLIAAHRILERLAKTRSPHASKGNPAEHER